MRQPTHDFHVNPFEAIGTEEIGSPDKSSPVLAYQAVFAKNVFVAKAHSYCNKTCVNLSTPKLSDEESGCLNTCLGKYSLAQILFVGEKMKLKKTMDEIKLNGGDIYARV